MSFAGLQRRGCLVMAAGGILAMSGCASRPPRTVQTPAFWSGRLALQIQSTPPQSWSASFELQGSADQGELSLFSPIGSTLARLSWTPLSALLEQGQDQTTDRSLDLLSQRLTGTQLPIQALFEWLNGRESNSSGWEADLSAQAQGRLTAKRSWPEPQAILRIVLDR